MSTVYEKLLQCYIYIIYRVPTGFGKKRKQSMDNTLLLPLSNVSFFLFVYIYVTLSLKTQLKSFYCDLLCSTKKSSFIW